MLQDDDILFIIVCLFFFSPGTNPGNFRDKEYHLSTNEVIHWTELSNHNDIGYSFVL